MIGRHIHANIKVSTAMCKDNNNSKSRAAACVKFDIHICKMISVDYIQCIKYQSF